MTDHADWNTSPDVAEFRAEIKNLKEAVVKLDGVVEALRNQIATGDRRQNDSCRQCTAWTRISTLEQGLAEMRGRIIGWALGAGGIMSFASFLASIMFHHKTP